MLGCCTPRPVCRFPCPEPGWRVLVISKDRPRQRLHRNLENTPQLGEKNDDPKGKKAENQTARYFAMISPGTEMRL